MENATSIRSRAVTVAIIVTGFLFGFVGSPMAPAYGADGGQPIAGIQCERQEYGNFHIHAHLDIFIDGKPHAVHESIGIIERTCLYWMHTHDRRGIIHVESPEARAFTLGQFFDIWKATQKGAPATKETPKIFVNGKPVNGRLEQVEIAPLSEIVIVYGKAPASILSTYDFPKGF